MCMQTCRQGGGVREEAPGRGGYASIHSRFEHLLKEMQSQKKRCKQRLVNERSSGVEMVVGRGGGG